MAYEDDYSSGEEEFHEDSLNNEDYDRLYELLPEVKTALATYNSDIDELSMKEALYYNYFELDAALEELRSKFPKKKGMLTSDSSRDPLSSRMLISDETPKLSKLALLAKQRALTRKTEDASILAPSTGTSKLAALARARGKSTGIMELKAPVAPEPKSRLVRKTNGNPIIRKRPLPAPEPQVKEIPKIISKPKESPQLKFDLQVEQSALLAVPENQISVFLFDSDVGSAYLVESNKRRKCAPQIFHAYTNNEPNIAKAKSNFSLPSPDDKVLEAQKQAFEGLNKLTVEEKPKEKVKVTKPFKKVDIAKELVGNTNFTKPNKSFVIIGHVDAGKSTLMGRILYDSGTVDAKTVNKLVREAEKSGKGSFALAWIMDQTTEERSRGVTIDICSTNFETEKTRFTAIDAPGHKDFVPQMIGGVSQADVALLVIDSITGEFEAGFMMDGQTKEHTLLAKNLGVDRIVVAVNKMDKENWDEGRFEDIKVQMTEFLTGPEVGYLKENVWFVPISGLTGHNVVKNDKSVADFSWYKGPTLVERLEQVDVETAATVEELENSDFNLAIGDVYDVTSTEFKIKGKITLGMVQPGLTVSIQPTEDVLQIQSVIFGGKPVDVAVRGQIVLLVFKVAHLKTKNTDDLSIGDLVLNVGSAIVSTLKFSASVNMFNMEKPLLVGTPFVCFRNNASVGARITKVVAINGTKKKRMHLVSKQTADVEIEILGIRPLPMTRFASNKALGRIVVRREGVTVGAGVVTDIEE